MFHEQHGGKSIALVRLALRPLKTTASATEEAACVSIGTLYGLLSNHVGKVVNRGLRIIPDFPTS